MNWGYLEDNMKTGEALLKCSTTNSVRRKLGEQLDPMDNEIRKRCAKRRGMESDSSKAGNNSFPKKLKVVVLNGKWDTTERVPSVIGEMHSNGFTEFRVPCSESSGSGISTEDDYCNIKQCSQITEGVDFLQTIPIKEYSGGDYEHNHDDENNCDENLSWLINFKVGSLFNTDEIQQNHKFGGRVEETACADSAINVKTQQPYAKQMETNPSYCGSTKPSFTYTELIQQALQEKRELTVSGIYQWISEHFPFYKANDDKWKNSVRHNLSINPHFQKGCKAPYGAGHLWVLADNNKYFQAVKKMKEHFQEFLTNTELNDEVQVATTSIQNNSESQDLHKEVMLSVQAEYSSEVQGNPNYTLPLGPEQRVSLEQSAEEILRGVKKNVQVEYIIPAREDIPSEIDFLNPVSMEEVVEESGLLVEVGGTGTSNPATDLNTPALDFNIEGDISYESLFSEETGCQYYELVSLPPELQD